MAFSPEELQGHGTHIKRRRVQYSTSRKQKLRHQYDVANKYVFKCRLNVDSDGDDVTNDGRLFHVHAHVKWYS